MELAFMYEKIYLFIANCSVIIVVPPPTNGYRTGEPLVACIRERCALRPTPIEKQTKRSNTNIRSASRVWTNRSAKQSMFSFP